MRRLLICLQGEWQKNILIIGGVPFLGISKVHRELSEFSKNEKLLLVCTKGKRAYMLQKRLKNFVYTNTLVFEGGTIFNESSL